MSSPDKRIFNDIGTQSHRSLQKLLRHRIALWETAQQKFTRIYKSLPIPWPLLTNQQTMLALPFAEDLHLHDSTDEVLLSLLDDHLFPPLDSMTTADDAFAQETTARVKRRSYAETATQSGVKHEPIPVLYVFAPYAARPSTKILKSNFEEKNRVEEVDDDLIYEQAKSLANRRLRVEHATNIRKLKIVETAYRLNIQESIQRLPLSQEAQLERAKSILKGARLLANGYFKKLSCFTPPGYRFDMPQDWTYNCSMQEYPHVLREYIVKEHMYDSDVEYALEELQNRIHMTYWGNAEYVAKHNYVTYHISMEHVLKNRLIPQYELLVKKLEIDQARTQKQRLWLIRSAIPSAKYIRSKTSRVEYAKQILQQ